MADENHFLPLVESMMREHLKKYGSIASYGSDVLNRDIAVLCQTIAMTVRDACTTIAEEYKAVIMRGIILGPEIANDLPHDGDELAPMLDEKSSAAKLANELSRVRGELIACAIRHAPWDALLANVMPKVKERTTPPGTHIIQ